MHYGVKVGRGTGAIIESHIKQVNRKTAVAQKREETAQLSRGESPGAPLLKAIISKQCSSIAVAQKRKGTVLLSRRNSPGAHYFQQEM